MLIFCAAHHIEGVNLGMWCRYPWQNALWEPSLHKQENTFFFLLKHHNLKFEIHYFPNLWGSWAATQSVFT